MKRNRTILLLPLCFAFMFNTCRKDSENCHHRLAIVNKSNKAIYVSLSLAFPDTIITNPNPSLSPGTHKTEANSENDWGISFGDCIEDVYKYRITSGKLMVFVFDATVLESTSWETVKQNYSILKRYDLTLQDLKTNNFTVTFP